MTINELKKILDQSDFPVDMDVRIQVDGKLIKNIGANYDDRGDLLLYQSC